jgi:hypothetical protein
MSYIFRCAITDSTRYFERTKRLLDEAVPCHSSGRRNKTQKQFVLSGKPCLGLLQSLDSELPPQRWVFKEEIAARMDRPNKSDKQEPQRMEHKPVVAESRPDSRFLLRRTKTMQNSPL